MLPSELLSQYMLPLDLEKQLAEDAKYIRLNVKCWKRSTLAKYSGVPESSIKRFENTGKVSLTSFLKIVSALGMASRLNDLLKVSVEGMSMDDFRSMTNRSKSNLRRGKT